MRMVLASSATTTGLARLLVECGADVCGPVQDEEALVDSRAMQSLAGFDDWYDRDSVAALVAVGSDPNALDALGRLPLIEGSRSHAAARAEAPLASADSDGVHVCGEEMVRELRARLAVAAGGWDGAAVDHDLRELRTRLARLAKVGHEVPGHDVQGFRSRLVEAAQALGLAAVSDLLAAGADARLLDSGGRSPFAVAASMAGGVEVLQALLVAAPDLGGTAGKGSTLLFEACNLLTGPVESHDRKGTPASCPPVRAR